MLIYYHENCSDGFCSLWVARKACPQGAEFKYVGLTAGQSMTYSQIQEAENKTVYFVDICPHISDLQKVADISNSVTILDHHASAEETIKRAVKMDKVYAVYDMTRSGAGITWDYFFINQPRPWLVDYTEDRDLWAHKLCYTKEINCYLQNVGFDFTTFDELSTKTIVEIYDISVKLLNQHNTMVSRASKEFTIEDVHIFTETNILHDKAILVNIGFPFISDVCNNLLEEHPDINLCVAFVRIKNGRWKISARSKDGAKISAKMYCEYLDNRGGGHEKAAGATISSLEKLGIQSFK